MGDYLSPGIYTKETDFSFYVKQISTSTTAMVGVAEKGPINQITLVRKSVSSPATPETRNDPTDV